jgi:hypothetical protein
MSWTKTAFAFLLMTSIYVSGVMAFMEVAAHITHASVGEIWPARTHFLRFYLPCQLCLFALIAICIRTGYNWRFARKDRAGEAHSQKLRRAPLNPR